MSVEYLFSHFSPVHFYSFYNAAMEMACGNIVQQINVNFPVLIFFTTCGAAVVLCRQFVFMLISAARWLKANAIHASFLARKRSKTNIHKKGWGWGGGGGTDIYCDVSV
jgi:hypothetical protein